MRNAHNKVLAGVCAGLADYFGFKRNIMRLFAIIALFIVPPVTVIAYFAAALFLPVNMDTVLAAGGETDAPSDARNARSIWLVLWQSLCALIVFLFAAGPALLGVIGACPDCGQAAAEKLAPTIWFLVIALASSSVVSWKYYSRRQYAVANTVSFLPLVAVVGAGLLHLARVLP